jgi:hypothetical protein
MEYNNPSLIVFQSLQKRTWLQKCHNGGVRLQEGYKSVTMVVSDRLQCCTGALCSLPVQSHVQYMYIRCTVCPLLTSAERYSHLTQVMSQAKPYLTPHRHSKGLSYVYYLMSQFCSKVHAVQTPFSIAWYNYQQFVCSKPYWTAVATNPLLSRTIIVEQNCALRWKSSSPSNPALFFLHLSQVTLCKKWGNDILPS